MSKGPPYRYEKNLNDRVRGRFGVPENRRGIGSPYKRQRKSSSGNDFTTFSFDDIPLGHRHQEVGLGNFNDFSAISRDIVLDTHREPKHEEKPSLSEPPLPVLSIQTSKPNVSNNPVTTSSISPLSVNISPTSHTPMKPSTPQKSGSLLSSFQTTEHRFLRRSFGQQPTSPHRNVPKSSMQISPRMESMANPSSVHNIHSSFPMSVGQTVQSKGLLIQASSVDTIPSYPRVTPVTPTKDEVYQPKVEAVSPSNSENEVERHADEATKEVDSNRKNELLKHMEKVDKEIAEVERKISDLKEEQNNLKEELSQEVLEPEEVKEEECVEEKSEKKEHENGVEKDNTDIVADLVTPEPKEKSLIERIYEENRKKAAAAHQQFAKLGIPLPNSLPLYNQPSDLPFYEEHRKTAKAVQFKLAKYFQRKRKEKQLKQRVLLEEYRVLEKKWLEKVEKLESNPKRKNKESRYRDFYEKLFPEIKRQREQTERFSRLGSRANWGLAARSEAEYNEILKDLNEKEKHEKHMRDLAVDPPPLLDEDQRRVKFINTNGLIKDLRAYVNERKLLNVWTDKEKEMFKEKYIEAPKDFEYIAKFLGNKDVKDCVLYYYRTKRTGKYKKLARKQSLKRKRIPNSGGKDEGTKSKILKPRTEGYRSESDIDDDEAFEEDSDVSEESYCRLSVSTSSSAGHIVRITTSQAGGKPEPVETPRWSKNEREIAIEGLRRHGRNWAAISQMVMTKTDAQCKNFYFNYKKKLDLETVVAQHSASKMQRQESEETISASEVSDDGYDGHNDDKFPSVVKNKQSTRETRSQAAEKRAETAPGPSLRTLRPQRNTRNKLPEHKTCVLPRNRAIHATKEASYLNTKAIEVERTTTTADTLKGNTDGSVGSDDGRIIVDDVEEHEGKEEQERIFKNIVDSREYPHDRSPPVLSYPLITPSSSSVSVISTVTQHVPGYSSILPTDATRIVSPPLLVRESPEGRREASPIIETAVSFPPKSNETRVHASFAANFANVDRSRTTESPTIGITTTSSPVYPSVSLVETPVRSPGPHSEALLDFARNAASNAGRGESKLNLEDSESEREREKVKISRFPDPQLPKVEQKEAIGIFSRFSPCIPPDSSSRPQVRTQGFPPSSFHPTSPLIPSLVPHLGPHGAHIPPEMFAMPIGHGPGFGPLYPQFIEYFQHHPLDPEHLVPIPSFSARLMEEAAVHQAHAMWPHFDRRGLMYGPHHPFMITSEMNRLASTEGIPRRRESTGHEPSSSVPSTRCRSVEAGVMYPRAHTPDHVAMTDMRSGNQQRSFSLTDVHSRAAGGTDEHRASPFHHRPKSSPSPKEQVSDQVKSYEPFNALINVAAGAKPMASMEELSRSAHEHVPKPLNVEDPERLQAHFTRQSCVVTNTSVIQDSSLEPHYGISTGRARKPPPLMPITGPRFQSHEQPKGSSDARINEAHLIGRASSFGMLQESPRGLEMVHSRSSVSEKLPARPSHVMLTSPTGGSPQQHPPPPLVRSTPPLGFSEHRVVSPLPDVMIYDSRHGNEPSKHQLYSHEVPYVQPSDALPRMMPVRRENEPVRHISTIAVTTRESTVNTSNRGSTTLFRPWMENSYVEKDVIKTSKSTTSSPSSVYPSLFDRRSLEMSRLPSEVSRPPSEMHRLPLDMLRPSLEMHRLSSELSSHSELLRPPLELSRSSKERPRPFSEFSRSSLEFSRAPSELSRLSTEVSRLPLERSRPFPEVPRVSPELPRFMAMDSVYSGQSPARPLHLIDDRGQPWKTGPLESSSATDLTKSSRAQHDPSVKLRKHVSPTYPMSFYQEPRLPREKDGNVLPRELPRVTYAVSAVPSLVEISSGLHSRSSASGRHDNVNVSSSSLRDTVPMTSFEADSASGPSPTSVHEREPPEHHRESYEVTSSEEGLGRKASDQTTDLQTDSDVGSNPGESSPGYESSNDEDGRLSKGYSTDHTVSYEGELEAGIKTRGGTSRRETFRGGTSRGETESGISEELTSCYSLSESEDVSSSRRKVCPHESTTECDESKTEGNEGVADLPSNTDGTCISTSQSDTTFIELSENSSADDNVDSSHTASYASSVPPVPEEGIVSGTSTGEHASEAEQRYEKKPDARDNLETINYGGNKEDEETSATEEGEIVSSLEDEEVLSDTGNDEVTSGSRNAEVISDFGGDEGISGTGEGEVVGDIGGDEGISGTGEGEVVSDIGGDEGISGTGEDEVVSDIGGDEGISGTGEDEIVSDLGGDEGLSGTEEDEMVSDTGGDEDISGTGEDEGVSGLGGDERVGGLGGDEGVSGLGGDEGISGTGEDEVVSDLGGDEGISGTEEDEVVSDIGGDEGISGTGEDEVVSDLGGDEGVGRTGESEVASEIGDEVISDIEDNEVVSGSRDDEVISDIEDRERISGDDAVGDAGEDDMVSSTGEDEEVNEMEKPEDVIDVTESEGISEDKELISGIEEDDGVSDKEEEEVSGKEEDGEVNDTEKDSDNEDNQAVCGIGKDDVISSIEEHEDVSDTRGDEELIETEEDMAVLGMKSDEIVSDTEEKYISEIMEESNLVLDTEERNIRDSGIIEELELIRATEDVDAVHKPEDDEVESGSKDSDLKEIENEDKQPKGSEDTMRDNLVKTRDICSTPDDSVTSSTEHVGIRDNRGNDGIPSGIEESDNEVECSDKLRDEVVSGTTYDATEMKDNRGNEEPEGISCIIDGQADNVGTSKEESAGDVIDNQVRSSDDTFEKELEEYQSTKEESEMEKWERSEQDSEQEVGNMQEFVHTGEEEDIEEHQVVGEDKSDVLVTVENMGNEDDDEYEVGFERLAVDNSDANSTVNTDGELRAEESCSTSEDGLQDEECTVSSAIQSDTAKKPSVIPEEHGINKETCSLADDFSSADVTGSDESKSTLPHVFAGPSLSPSPPSVSSGIVAKKQDDEVSTSDISSWPHVSPSGGNESPEPSELEATPDNRTPCRTPPDKVQVDSASVDVDPDVDSIGNLGDSLEVDLEPERDLDDSNDFPPDRSSEEPTTTNPEDNWSDNEHVRRFEDSDDAGLGGNEAESSVKFDEGRNRTQRDAWGPADVRDTFADSRGTFVDSRDNFVDSRGTPADSRDNFVDSRENFVNSRDTFVDSGDTFSASRDNFVDLRDNFVDSRDNFVDTRDNFVDSSTALSLSSSEDIDVKHVPSFSPAQEDTPGTSDHRMSYTARDSLEHQENLGTTDNTVDTSGMSPICVTSAGPKYDIAIEAISSDEECLASELEEGEIAEAPGERDDVTQAPDHVIQSSGSYFPPLNTVPISPPAEDDSGETCSTTFFEWEKSYVLSSTQSSSEPTSLNQLASSTRVSHSVPFPYSALNVRSASNSNSSSPITLGFVSGCSTPVLFQRHDSTTPLSEHYEPLSDDENGDEEERENTQTLSENDHSSLS